MDKTKDNTASLVFIVAVFILCIGFGFIIATHEKPTSNSEEISIQKIDSNVVVIVDKISGKRFLGVRNMNLHEVGYSNNLVRVEL
jgi:hypothetical protein